MRHFLVVLLSASFLTSFPPAPKVAEAQTLFEVLFPRSAERRQKRQRLQRQRRLDLFELDRRRQRALNKRRKKQAVRKRRSTSSGGSAVISGPQYYNYRARGLGVVPVAKLSSAFAKREAMIEAERQTAKDAMVRDHFETKRMNLDSFAAAARAPEPEQAGMDKAAIRAAISSVRVKARSGISKALIAHYKKSPEFLWLTDDGRANGSADAVVSVLNGANSVGLNAEDYAIPVKPAGGNVNEAMQFEFALTVRALRYLADARHGIVDPNRISGYHDFGKNYANYGKLIAALAAATDPAKLLNDANPPDPAFAALKAELAVLSGTEDASLPPLSIAAGTFINPGEVDYELENVVEAIRRRAKQKIQDEHADVLAGDHSGGEYTPEVVALVKDMQKGLGLRPDGIIGKNTIRRLLGGQPATSESKRKKILYAMERLRWHPDQLGNTHVMINQPAYRVNLKRGGRTQLAMNVVVGKRSNQTYFFQDKISYVEFNPYWGIPRSILVNEYLPKLRSNAGYLDNRGYEVTDIKGRQISSYNVDWWNVDKSFPFNVRQPPGPKNALGRLKIMFPNKHSIYMHDTPAKSLFSRRKRAFSHGCVRLAEPRRMAAAVLGISVDQVNDNIAQGSNMTRKLKRKIPVYVSYFTAWPTDDGDVRYFADVYGRDVALAKALKAERAARERAREV